MKESNNRTFGRGGISFLFFLSIAFSLNAQVKTKPNQTKPATKMPAVVGTPVTVLTAREIANKVMPSTVLITTLDENGNPIAQGSGFVFRPGLIATNLHVFNRASKATVKFVGKEEIFKIIEVVGINRRRDICVVRIDEVVTKPLSLLSGLKVQVGDDIFVAGNPKGLEGSFSKGIVSANRPNIGLLQIDASISHGSSGGPVVNNKGDLVGIVVSSMTNGQNLNFVIPAEYLLSEKLEFSEPVSTAGALSFSDRERDQLNGMVESFEEREADFELDTTSGRFVEGESKLLAKKTFDVYGSLLKLQLYNKGILGVSDERTYDDRGFLRSTNWKIDLSFSGKEPEGKMQEYSVAESIKNAQRNKQFEQVQLSDGGGATLKYVYDERGRLIEVFGKGKSSVKILYSFDQNGFMSEMKIYRNNELATAEQYRYLTDEQGNWLKKITTSSILKTAITGYIPSSVSYRKINYFR